MVNIAGFMEFSEELEDFADDLDEIADEVDEAIDEETRNTALQVEGTARRKAPVDDGDLRASLGITPLAQAKYSVGSDVDHAPPTEYGSAPHAITPDTAEWLQFRARDGRWVKTDFVWHPGTPAQPFLRPAIEQHRSDLTENIREAIEDLIEDQL